MTLLTYEIFQTVVEYGSFSKAATQLHLTPSAISHAISSMEEELGFTLFIRRKQGVSLTSSGKSLLPHIQKVITSNMHLSEAISQLQGLQAGSVKIGCTNSVCIRWIPGIIRRFNEDYPQIQVEIYQGSYTDVVNWLKGGTIDLCIISQAVVPNFPFLPLYEDDLVCVTPKGYMPQYTQFMTPDDLKNQPFVIQQDSCDQDIVNFLNHNDLTIRANCHILDDQSTIAMVECGAGISIMPSLLLTMLQYDVDYYPIQPRAYRTLGICYPNPDALSPSGKAMIRYIKEEMTSKKYNTPKRRSQ